MMAVAAALSVGTGAVAVGRAALLGVEAAAGAVIYFFCVAFRGLAHDAFSRAFFVVFHKNEPSRALNNKYLRLTSLL